MSFEIIEKQFGEYLSVEAKVEAGKFVTVQSVDLSKLLDEGALKVKALIPGQVDDLVIDLIVSKLKEVLLA